MCAEINTSYPKLEEQDFQPEDKVHDWTKEHIADLRDKVEASNVRDELAKFKVESEKYATPIDYLKSLKLGESAKVIGALQSALQLLYKKDSRKYKSPGIIDGVFKAVSHDSNNPSNTMNALKSVTGNQWIDGKTFEKVIETINTEFNLASEVVRKVDYLPPLSVNVYPITLKEGVGGVFELFDTQGKSVTYKKVQNLPAGCSINNDTGKIILPSNLSVKSHVFRIMLSKDGFKPTWFNCSINVTKKVVEVVEPSIDEIIKNFKYDHNGREITIKKSNNNNVIFLYKGKEINNMAGDNKPFNFSIDKIKNEKLVEEINEFIINNFNLKLSVEKM